MTMSVDSVRGEAYFEVIVGAAWHPLHVAQRGALQIDAAQSLDPTAPDSRNADVPT